MELSIGSGGDGTIFKYALVIEGRKFWATFSRQIYSLYYFTY